MLAVAGRASLRRFQFAMPIVQGVPLIRLWTSPTRGTLLIALVVAGGSRYRGLMSPNELWFALTAWYEAGRIRQKELTGICSSH